MVGEEVRRVPYLLSKGRLTLSSSSSCSSSSYLSLSPGTENCGECGLDGMELEAARALACISRTVVRDGGGRGLNRFKNRSQDRDWEISDQGWELAHDSEDNKAIRAKVEEETKVQQTSERLPPSSNHCTNSLSFSGRKTRLNLSCLTEAEKEARRVRRVVANRESARQTIRRRQAFRDGLAKKVSDLSLVNQNMKREKGQITKEYMWLRNKNEQLKAELAIAVAAHSGLCYNTSGSDRYTEPRTPCFWFCSLLDQMSASRHLLSGNWKDNEVDFLAGCSKTTVAEEKPALQEQNQRENLATHALGPLKDKTMKVDKSHKLDIDLNSSSVTPEPSLDPPTSAADEPVRAFLEQSTKFLCTRAAASARRRRKEIMKLKHLCGRPIVLPI